MTRWLWLEYDGDKYGKNKLEIEKGLLEPSKVCINVHNKSALEDFALLEANYPGMLKKILIESTETLVGEYIPEIDDMPNDIEHALASFMCNFFAVAYTENQVIPGKKSSQYKGPKYFDLMVYDQVTEAALCLGLKYEYPINMDLSTSKLEEILKKLEGEGVNFKVSGISLKSQFCQH